MLNDGDEVLIPSPDYPLWTASVILNGGKAVHYPCPPEKKFQMQGLIVEADENEYLTFYFFSRNGSSNPQVRADSWKDGVLTKQNSVAVSSADPRLALRVTRTGDTWDVAYQAADQASWTTFSTFNYALPVTEAGIFAGNVAPSGGSSPGVSARLSKACTTFSCSTSQRSFWSNSD